MRWELADIDVLFVQSEDLHSARHGGLRDLVGGPATGAERLEPVDGRNQRVGCRNLVGTAACSTAGWSRRSLWIAGATVVVNLST
jgi:hypothetical protein